MAGNMIDKVFNNRYRLTDRIGVGGMAEVYRAHDEVLGRTVAVKIMLPHYATDPAFTKRFRQEAAAAANLQSPFIVNVYDWGQDDDVSYIVMEYVRGSDLKTAIIERGAINQRKVAEIGMQVCQALTTAHNLDIIHRDIKPQNIMVQPDGNVRVMDFGIARAKNSVMTQTPSVLGTAHYISPEQAQGKELTSASDIYSLGIVLYEAATGVLPFDGPDAVSVAMQQVNDAPQPPQVYNPDIHPDLEDIIMKALSKRPSERFATAQEMRLALNDFLGGRPIDLGDDFSRAETAVLGGVGMAGNVGADGTAVMPPLMKPAAPAGGQSTNYRSGNSSQQENSTKRTVAIVASIVGVLLIAAIVAFLFVTNTPATGDPVPNVVGKTLEEAKLALTEAGFEVGVVVEEYSKDVEAGKIVKQDPDAKKLAEKGSKINLVVSKGAEQVTVPDLTGKTAEEARTLLSDLGLTATAGQAEYSDEIEINKVARQDPAAGGVVSKGTAVTYFLSLGTEPGTVPNVIGLSPSDAVKALQDAGFVVNDNNIIYEFNNNEPENKVYDQNPKAGMTINKGQTVDITVSKGPEKFAVPSLVGKTRVDAEKSVAGVGLVLSVSSEEYNDQYAAGIVVRQDPAEGTMAAKGSKVTVIISKGPDPSSGN